MGLINHDLILQDRGTLANEPFWQKPILPYVAGFVILVVHWWKYMELHFYLERARLAHFILHFAYLFFVCLYPFAEMDIEFASGSASSRLVFTILWGMLGVLAFWILKDADRNDHLSDAISRGRIDTVGRELLIEPAVAVLCVPLAFASFYVWLTAMVILVVAFNLIAIQLTKKPGSVRTELA